MVIVLSFLASTTLRLITYVILPYRLTNQIVKFPSFLSKESLPMQAFQVLSVLYYNFLLLTIIKALSYYGISLTLC